MQSVPNETEWLREEVNHLRTALAAKEEALRGNEDTWVRVEDGMPKRGHTVIVVLDGEKLAAIWNGEKWFMPCFRGSDWLPEKAMSGITHWMLLPPTPTPAEDGHA